MSDTEVCVSVRADCRSPGGAVVRQPVVLPLQPQHPGSHAGQPSGSLWVLLPLPHQPFQDMLLQVTLLAAQTPGIVILVVFFLLKV